VGTTGYQNMTPREAIAYELRDCEVLGASGAWRLIRYTTSDGETVTTLAYCITSRSDGWAYVKVVPANMGPGATPPATIYRRYVGMVPDPANEYEAEWRQGVESELSTHASLPNVRPGDTFTITDAPAYCSEWADGRPVCGTYRMLRRYSAMRDDGRTVRLPKSWRKTYTYELVPA